MKNKQKYRVRDAIFDLSKLDLDEELDLCAYWVQGPRPIVGSKVINGKLTFYSDDRRNK